MIALQNAKDVTLKKEVKLIKPSQIIFYIFTILLFLFTIYYFSEIKKDFKLLEEVKVFWLVIAVVAQCATYFFTALIYRLLLNANNLPERINVKELLQVSVISLFFNQTIPSAGLSGNTFLFNYLLKKRITVSKIVTIILSELLLFYLAMVVVVIFYIIACTTFYKTHAVFLPVLTGGLVVYFVFGAFVILASSKKYFSLLIKKMQSVKYLKKHFTSLSDQFQKSNTLKSKISLLKFLSASKQNTAWVISLQLIIATTDAFTIFCLFYGLGVPVSYFLIVLGFICTKIISILPFAPGALILYESSMTFFYATLSLPVGTSMVVTLLYRFLSFWLPIPIGLFLYKRWHQQHPDAVQTS